MSGAGSVRGSLLRPDHCFLLLGSLGAFVLLGLTPPFQVPDEPAHFFRSFTISEGDVLGVRRGQSAGVWIPESLLLTKKAWQQQIPFHSEVRLDLERARQSLELPLAPERRRYKDIRNVLAYSPVPYLPQVVGVWLGRALGAPPIALLYLARLVNALAAFALCLFAIRLVPFGRWPFLLMLLTPISCFLRSSASPDAVTNALAFVNVAASLSIGFAPAPPGRKLSAVYVVSALLLFLSKQAYLTVPLALAAGLTNRAVKGACVRLLLAAYLPGAFLVAAWLSLAADVVVPVLPGSEPFTQLRLVLTDPLRYAGIVAAHFVARWTAHGAGLVGLLGWLDTPLPRWLVAVWWLAFAAVTAFAAEAQRPGPLQRLVLLACTISGYLGVMTLIYLLMPVGAEELGGIQARYLIPLLTLLAFAALALRPSAALQRLAPPLCAGVAALALLVSFATLLDRYWLALW